MLSAGCAKMVWIEMLCGCLHACQHAQAEAFLLDGRVYFLQCVKVGGGGVEWEGGSNRNFQVSFAVTSQDFQHSDIAMLQTYTMCQS